MTPLKQVFIVVAVLLVLNQNSITRAQTEEEVTYFLDDFEGCDPNTNCIVSADPYTLVGVGLTHNQLSHFTVTKQDVHWNNNKLWKIYSGNYNVDMSGNTNNLGTMETTNSFQTPVGKQCTLSFALGANFAGFHVQDKVVLVEVFSVEDDDDDTMRVIASQTFTYKTLANQPSYTDMKYQLVSMTFDGAAETKLRFTSLAEPGWGAVIDLVKVVGPPLNSAPVCNATFSPSFIWPVNHKRIYPDLNVFDADGDRVTVNVTSIMQNEPVDEKGSGPGGPGGPDASLADSSSPFWVKAERSGNGTGRVYVVSYTATDSFGESCEGSAELCVPHDKANPTCPPYSPDSLYDSTVDPGKDKKVDLKNKRS